jgi:hypothetical protein
MNVRYRVELSQAEREELQGLLSGGKHAARKLKRAQILLAADAGACDEEIVRSVGASGSTVSRTKRRFVLGNLEAALSEEPRPCAQRRLSGKEEALLVATACSKPPAGLARWTLELLAGEMVTLTEHAELSRETVRRRLAENDLKPWRRDMWCIPEVDGTYVARMEDVLVRSRSRISSRLRELCARSGCAQAAPLCISSAARAAACATSAGCTSTERAAHVAPLRQGHRARVA